MKYTNEGVCHAWAHQTDHDASNAGGTLYSVGTVIFSYGSHFPIARIDGDKVLFTTASYSNTTAKQMSYARRAIPASMTVYNVADVSAIDYKAKRANYDDYRERYNDLLAKASRARSNKEWLLNEAIELANEANNYADAYKIRGKRIDTSAIDLDSIAEIVKAEAKRKKAAKQREQKALERKHKKAIEAWCNGEAGARMPYVEKVYLRVVGENVETSKHANFPVSHAHFAWRVIEKCRASGSDWHSNGHTVKLGHYEVQTIKANGDLIAGCHYVTFDQSERIARELGLIGG